MKIALGKKAIGHIEKKCRERVTAMMEEIAKEAAAYLLNFGYHAFLRSGPDSGDGPGWSWYYAANWNVAVGSPDRSVITPERDPFDEEEKAYELELYEKLDALNGRIFEDTKFGDTLFVTNSVYYGRWLNEGGTEFLAHLNEAKPNRFIELCEAHLRNEIPRLIRMVKGEK